MLRLKFRMDIPWGSSKVKMSKNRRVGWVKPSANRYHYIQIAHHNLKYICIYIHINKKSILKSRSYYSRVIILYI